MEYGMEDFQGYEIWKISIPFHFIACLVVGHAMEWNRNFMEIME